MKKKSATTSRTKAVLAAKAALDKKAHDVVVLDMRKVSNFTNYFVIAGGASDRQVKAIADAVMEKLAAKGLTLRHKEGYKEALWVVLDYTDIIVHVFHNQTREFYLLERLWADAAKVAVKS